MVEFILSGRRVNVDVSLALGLSALLVFIILTEGNT